MNKLKNISNILSLLLAVVLAFIGLVYLIDGNYFMFVVLLMASGIWFIEVRVNLIYQKLMEGSK